MEMDSDLENKGDDKEFDAPSMTIYSGDERLISLEGRRVYVRKLSVEDFCTECGLEAEIGKILGLEGYATAGALFEASDDDLKKHSGLKIGQYAELRKAMREFLRKAMLEEKEKA
ncbi:hypothetical protein B0H16DRAFT_1700931 [Mycena metata]|uniref:SAM domain-containing protein n=1 Tax=Mycena metata TaxID=1033252 RepID=A0AAD7MHF7_9AGAR|nr:hypothetical protein B0H16DRAFT_1700931 [Mycena metata]